MLPMFPRPPPPPPFYHAVHMPPPPFYHAVHMPPPPLHAAVFVHQVWMSNFREESEKLLSFAAGARYVAVNVQYPGLVHPPDRDHKALTVEQRYALVKANVDALKPLQVGIAVCDWQGTIHAWEFNLCDFCRHADLHDENSLAYLAGRGLDVDTLTNKGIPARIVGAMLLGSGLFAPLRGLPWITYTGTYHVAYLLKIIKGGGPLPHNVVEFVGDVRKFLGDQVYDVAGMAAECPALPVGLERIAAHLGFHPPSMSPKLAAAAGVRALQVFRSLKYGKFRGDVWRYRGLLQGLQY